MIKKAIVEKRVTGCSNCPFFHPTLGVDFYCAKANKTDDFMNITYENRWPEWCPLEEFK